MPASAIFKLIFILKSFPPNSSFSFVFVREMHKMHVLPNYQVIWNLNGNIAMQSTELHDINYTSLLSRKGLKL